MTESKRLCCSQEAHTLCVKIGIGHTEYRVNVWCFKYRDCCDDRAGLAGGNGLPRVAWPARADSAVQAVLPHCRGAWGQLGTPAPCGAMCCPQSHVPSALPPPALLAPRCPPAPPRQGQASWALAWPSRAVLGSRGAYPSPPRVCTASCCPMRLPAPSAHPQRSAAPQHWPAAWLTPVFLQRPCLLRVALLSLLGPVPGAELAA